MDGLCLLWQPSCHIFIVICMYIVFCLAEGGEGRAMGRGSIRGSGNVVSSPSGVWAEELRSKTSFGAF